MEMEEEGDGEGKGWAIESREKEESERMNWDDSEPKAPKVSRMKGTNLEERERAREEYLVVLEVVIQTGQAHHLKRNTNKPNNQAN